MNYTYKDVHDWEVVNYEGQILSYKDKDGKDVLAKRYDGYKSASAVAFKLGGVARRSRS